MTAAGRQDHSIGSTLDPALRAALDAASRGQREPALGALAHLSNRDPAHLQACEFAVQADLALTHPSQTTLPDRDAVARHLDAAPDTRAAASLACSAAATASVLGLDSAGLSEWNVLSASLLRDQPTGVAAGWLTLSRAWEQLIGGAGAEVDATLEALRAAAVDAQAAVLAVEATALRALAALNQGNIEKATERGRRASRMARTEAIPRAEFMAHLVLARMRRVSGKPHLAARILSSLLEFAAPPWHPWMLWELTLAGGQPTPDTPGPAAPWPALDQVRLLLDAARAGNQAAFDERLSSALAAVSGWAWFDTDLHLFHHLVDPRIALEALDPRVVGWVRGQTAETPFGLHGLCANPIKPEADEDAVAYVIASPDLPARRILSFGLELLPGEAIRLAQMRRRSGRLDTAAAALALAGPEGMESTEFFRSVYGFAYTPEIHRGVIKTLVHRLRARLDVVARVHSESGRLRLEHITTAILPDPRCSAALNDRVLWLLSTHRGLSARDAAERLQLPLRTVQTALHELVEDGSCESQRMGRNVSYEVEDTTFSEPTLILRRRGKFPA